MSGKHRPRHVRGLPTIVGLWFVLLVASGGLAASAQQEARLYFFWGDGCPHCAAAKPFLAELEAVNPGLVVVAKEVWYDAANQQELLGMAGRHGFQPTGVPTFLLGGQHWVGFNEGIAAQLDQAVQSCLATGCPDAGTWVAGAAPPASAAPGSFPGTPVDAPPPAASETLTLPGGGRVDLASLSLPVTTLLIAAVDGFNPCSLWVLGVLIALTLRTGSRRVTVIVGLVFITVTALVYGLFIAGIFTVVSIATMSPWLRALVAIIAVAFALINIKDYFWFKKGPSLTIPEGAKPGIYARMRGVLANADNVPALVGSTILLAAGVSIVELACTAGFPIVWTNILAERQLAGAAFLGLLALYLLVYQLDELLIFGAAVLTLRASKLQEGQGRVLKLASGMLMLTLAVVMVVDPSWMSGLGSALLVFAVALAATALVLLVHRALRPDRAQHCPQTSAPPAEHRATTKGRSR